MTILITGANRGIGKYLYEYFKEGDNEVFGTYYSSAPILKDSNLFKVNISSLAEVERWLEYINITNKKIVLINVAGILKQGFAHKVNIDDWNEVINVNLLGTMNVVRSVLPYMRDTNYGRIINFSSVVASRGVVGTSAYAASKAGLLGLTKAIAIENATKGITVNCISPGYFDIGMGVDFSVDLLEDIKNKIPMKRFGHVEDILNAVNFIIGCSYMTGNTIHINGGFY